MNQPSVVETKPSEFVSSENPCSVLFCSVLKCLITLNWVCGAIQCMDAAVCILMRHKCASFKLWISRGQFPSIENREELENENSYNNDLPKSQQ